MANGKCSRPLRRFSSSQSIAMVFGMNLELGTLSRDEKESKVFDQVTHLMEKMRQPIREQKLDDTQTSSGYKTMIASRSTQKNSGSRVVKVSKASRQDRVSKRGKAKQAEFLRKVSDMPDLEFMVTLSQDTTQWRIPPLNLLQIQQIMSIQASTFEKLTRITSLMMMTTRSCLKLHKSDNKDIG
jgi:hypothetical protein